jgi:hypothetical protein
MTKIMVFGVHEMQLNLILKKFSTSIIWSLNAQFFLYGFVDLFSPYKLHVANNFLANLNRTWLHEICP